MEYKLDEIPVSLASHPTESVIAVGCIDGTITIFSITKSDLVTVIPPSKKCRPSTSTNDNTQLVKEWSEKHKAPIRKVVFSSKGDVLYSITRNRTITLFDTSTGRKLRVVRNIAAKEALPYCATSINEHQLAVGDELGALSVFDWRCDAEPPLATRMTDDDDETGGGDYLTDVITPVTGERGLLLATCGDGTLVAADVRKKRFIMRSEAMHDELLCLTAMKNNKKLLCGSADSHMEVFNWSEWGNIIERVDTGHEDTVECMCSLDNDFLVTGSSDGTVRLHSVLPNRQLALVSGKVGAAPIEGVALCQDYLISCDQDGVIKLFSATSLIESVPKTKSGSEMKKLTRKSKVGRTEFFNDLISEENIDDSSNSSSDGDSDSS